MSRKETLGRVRMQVQMVRKLNEQVKEISGSGLRSMRLDGAPAPELPESPEDALERMLHKESELLRTYEREARKEMDAMKPEQYAFCAMYYIAGFSLEETAATMKKSIRQCMRYKHEIEAA